MTSNPQFLAGERLTASKLQQLGFQDTYTPTLTATTTNPSLGTGPIQDGFIVRNANSVSLWIWLKFGSSPSAGSGTYQVGLPVGYSFSGSLFGGPVGTVWIRDNTNQSAPRLGVALADVVSDTIWMRTTSNDALVTNSAPWTWAEDDIISLHVQFPID